MSAVSEVGLQYLVKFRSGQDYRHVYDEAGEVPVIGSGGPFATANAHLYDGESVLFGRKGTIDRPRHVKGKFWTVDTMFFTELSGAVDGRWLYYWATTIPYGLYSTDTALPSMTSSTLGRLKVPWVALPTQQRIADYLDRETGEIDAMLAKMEELTEELVARRGAVIDAATSAGTPTQLHYLITQDAPLTYGIVQAGPDVDDGVPYIGPSDIFDHHVVEIEQLRKTAYSIASNYQRSTVQGGDLVVSIGPAYGKTTIIPNTHSGANLTQDTARVRCDERKCQPRYVQWALRSRAANEFWDSRIMGATFRRLNLNLLAVTPVPLPSLDEQTRIADHLDEVTHKIDQMLAKTAELKSLLIERRSALITDVVTGKNQVHS